MNGPVWVAPSGHLESECVARLLEARDIEATTDMVGRPAVLLLLGAPGVDIPQTMAALDDLGLEIPWLLVADTSDEHALTEARRRGVQRVSWGVECGVLLRVIEGLLGRRPAGRTPSTFGSARLNRLTEREREIVSLLSQGRHNDEIAAELGISYHTVRTHVQHVLTKLGMPHRHAVAALAQRSEPESAPVVVDGMSR